MTLNDIPQDSLLVPWLKYLQITEVPFSYSVAGGLSAIGALLRRNRWVDQHEWRVYPNQSVMFIGPSGVGKDTIINRIQRTIEASEYLSRVPILGGTTLESIQERLKDLPRPAAAYIPAPEMTAFFGKADYQANMLTGITNLLSNGTKIDITTKGALRPQNGHQGQPQIIWEPTITMHAGSTVEWLHKGMPDGTLEGGFMGRFLIVIEELGSRFIPLVKRDKTRQELDEIKGHLKTWQDGVEALVKACARPRELILYEEAEHLYSNWYYNRFKYFSKAVLPYANRSRDMVLRLAMLMALSRGHHRWIEGEDVKFGINLMHEVAQKIDKVVLPPTKEAVIGMKILEILPATRGEMYANLGMRYETRMIEEAIKMLLASGRVRVSRDNTRFEVVTMEGEF